MEAAILTRLSKISESVVAYVAALIRKLRGVEETPPIHSEPEKPKRNTSKQKTPEISDFTSLLDNIDDAFDSMNIPTMTGSWLPRKDIRALHKIGVYVKSDEGFFEICREATIPADISLPAIMSCHLINKKNDTENRLHPRFIFAIKQPTLPSNVERVPGTVYRFAQAIEPKAGNMFWFWCWLVVRPDGQIVIPNEFSNVDTRIIHRRKRGGSRFDVVSNKIWHRPSMAMSRDGFSEEEVNVTLTSTFRQLVLWWVGREQNWSVGVRRLGKRVTFVVDRKHTSAYFKNRQKQVTQNGRTRPIIHFVEEHVRENGSRVKAHVRGLSSFEWRGYKCAVTAPNLRGFVATNAGLAPVEVRKDMDPKELVDSVELSKILANSEDRAVSEAA